MFLVQNTKTITKCPSQIGKFTVKENISDKHKKTHKEYKQKKPALGRRTWKFNFPILLILIIIIGPLDLYACRSSGLNETHVNSGQQPHPKLIKLSWRFDIKCVEMMSQLPPNLQETVNRIICDSNTNFIECKAEQLPDVLLCEKTFDQGMMGFKNKSVCPPTVPFLNPTSSPVGSCLTSLLTQATSAVPLFMNSA